MSEWNLSDEEKFMTGKGFGDPRSFYWGEEVKESINKLIEAYDSKMTDNEVHQLIVKVFGKELTEVSE